MPGIFVSYRQEDTKAWAIQLGDELGRVFGEDQVFLDKDTLQAGNWREQIEKALETCRVVLVLIGPRWLTIADAESPPRIQLADDVHHQEIALALRRRDLTVIPLLVDDAPMPRPDQLPADLQALCDQQARRIGDARERRKADLAVLVRDIQSVGGVQLKPIPSTTRVEPTQAPMRIGWLQFFDAKALGSAFALALVVGVYAYIAGSPIDGSGLLFVLLAFYVAARAARWLWARVRRRRREQG